MIGEDTLITKDSKGKIRVVEISYQWEDEYKGFVIRRTTYQYGGKRTVQPEIVISKGKAKRTVSEQAQLEYNSHIKKYKDKGYKQLIKSIDKYTKEELDKILPEHLTGSDGIIKPMLAKQADSVASSVFNRQYMGSRKINGVRCLIMLIDGQITTRSRGAIDYDFPLHHIIQHPKLIKFFENHPDIILDGEIYHFGMPLSRISGLCRTQSTIEESEVLEYYLYDIADTTKPFSERYEMLQDIGDELGLSFNPIREWNKDDLKIQLVPHIEMTGWSEIKRYHDKYVSEGWEGLVIRRVDSVYKPGSRTNDWLKIKEYHEAEYPIVGLSEGLREEDMCFILETPEGKQFNCKPMGDRELKQWYRDHIDELIGKLLTIKYFEMSNASGSPVPQQPCGIAIRDYE